MCGIMGTLATSCWLDAVTSPPTPPPPPPSPLSWVANEPLHMPIQKVKGPAQAQDQVSIKYFPDLQETYILKQESKVGYSNMATTPHDMIKDHAKARFHHKIEVCDWASIIRDMQYLFCYLTASIDSRRFC